VDSEDFNLPDYDELEAQGQKQVEETRKRKLIELGEVTKRKQAKRKWEPDQNKGDFWRGLGETKAKIQEFVESVNNRRLNERNRTAIVNSAKQHFTNSVGDLLDYIAATDRQIERAIYEIEKVAAGILGTELEDGQTRPHLQIPQDFRRNQTVLNHGNTTQQTQKK
jgi:hydrogenase maturation factor HypF (carbamoyltransferase family)